MLSIGIGIVDIPILTVLEVGEKSVGTHMLVCVSVINSKS